MNSQIKMRDVIFFILISLACNISVRIDKFKDGKQIIAINEDDDQNCLPSNSIVLITLDYLDGYVSFFNL